MACRLYVGNIAYSLKEEDLRNAFMEVGEVVSVSIIRDRATGQSRGFAFVEMATEDDAKNAIAVLNGKPLETRRLIVSEARPQPNRDASGGGRGKPGASP